MSLLVAQGKECCNEGMKFNNFLSIASIKQRCHTLESALLDKVRKQMNKDEMEPKSSTPLSWKEKQQ